MAYNPGQVCFDCTARTKGPRFLRCTPCAVVHNKQKAKELLGVRSCRRCERPAVFRRWLCSKCQPAADRERKARHRVFSANWKKNNPEKAAACHKAAMLKNREHHLRRNRLRQRGRKAENVSCSRRWKAKHKPWSAKRTAKLLADLQAAVPRTLPRDVRDDVVSTMMLSVFEGKLDQFDIAAKVTTFITPETRRFFDVSLDAPIPGTNLRLIDAISSR